MIRPPENPVRVLLVDDDAEDAVLTQRLLHSAVIGNYQVDWRDGFDSGLAALDESDYDVMLLDYQLSGENGLDLLKFARDRGTRSPAILLTGQVNRDLDLKAMQAGVVDFLEKDTLNATNLERSIRYAAGRGRSERERTNLLTAESVARAAAEAAQARTAEVLATLVAERALFRDVLEQLPIGVAMADVPSGKVTFANAEITKMLRLPGNLSETVAAQPEWPGIHPDGQKYAPADWPLTETIRTGEPVVAEDVRMIRGDGTVARIRLNSALVKGIRGEGVAGVVTMEDVSLRCEAEMALQRSEAFFRAAFLSSAAPGLLVTPEGVVIQANRAMSNLLGYEVGGLDGMNVLAFTTPFFREATQSARTRMVAGEIDSAQIEKRYIHRDGHQIDVLVTVAVVKVPGDEPFYFSTQVTDISDRKRAEDAVRQRERDLADIVSVQQEIGTMAIEGTHIIELVAERSRSLTNADGAGVALLEGDLLVYRSGAGEQSPLVGLGLKLDSSLTGRCIRDRVATRSDDATTDQRVNQSFAAAMNARSIVCVPLLHHDTPVGALTVFSHQPNAFSDGDVHTLQLMAGLAAAAMANRTAFAAKQALVVERTAALVTLGEKESLIRSLIENAADPLITLDEGGLISYASPSLERLLGRPASDFLGVHPLTLCHPDDHAFFAGTLDIMVANAQRNVAVEARLAHRDGSWRLLRVTGRNMLEDPAVRGIIVNLHDMTDEVMVATQLRQAQKLEAVGQLAGGVAHDFNNLLTVISGHCEFLTAALDTDDPRADDVKEIRLASDRAAGLTKQLLAFSRQQMLVPEVIDMNEVVAGVSPMLQRLIGEDITFVIAPSTARVNFLADRGEVEQVIMNLVINGRDAMPNGGTLTVDVQVTDLDDSYLGHADVKPGRYVMLAVTDTGMGMSEAVREKIFEPFFTTKEAGTGTGLGLSTVYGIVKQSNGYVWVYSEPGLGSTFKVYFPLTVDASEPAEPAPVVLAVGGSETILLVEDEKAVRGISRRILAEHGYTVLEARDGVHALEVAESHQGEIHLLVTDVVMPRMNGRVLAEHLAQRLPEISVLYLSGYTNDDIIRRNPEATEGRFRLLQKPFTSVALAAAVREALAINAAPAEMAGVR